ncbi:MULTISPECIES: phage tail tape measure protein [unclassified Pseudomonas]|uniref:phage tail tape measure protein n=1 Tax=unclassified Pseudomonas TaxID=196821 RepID=UPI0021158681|nr:MULTISPECIES: phage tail tape measure protein [unclassified Pseudomonas]
MASRSLGTLTLDLIAKVGGFVSGMGQAERSSEKWRKTVEKNAQAAGIAIGAGFAAGAVALAAFTVSTVQAASEITRLAGLAGTGTTEFQKFAIGAKTVGIEQDKLADIFKDVNDKVGDFLLNGGGELQDFFKTIAPQVGVTAEQFRNLSGPQALQLFTSSLQKAGLSQAEMTQQMEALANDATLLLPLLRDNGDAFKILGDTAQQAGAIMDEKTIKATQGLAAAGWLAEQSLTGIKNQVAASLMPALSDYADILFDLSQDTASVSLLSDGLNTVLKLAAKTAVGISYAFELVGKSIAGVVAIVTSAFDGVDLSSPIDAIQKIGENSSRTALIVGDDLDGLDKKYNDLWKRIDDAGSNGQASGHLKAISEALNKVSEPVKPGTFKAPTAEMQAAAKAAEAAQKKIQAAFDSSEEGYERQIALINTEVDKRKNASEVAKLQFEIESGKLVGINTLQQERLKGLAEELDRLQKLKLANEDAAKSAAYAATLNTSNQTAREGFGMELAGAGLGDKARERLQQDLQIQQDFNQQMAELQQQYNSGDISKELYDTETQMLSEALAERMVIQQDYYNQLDAAQSNWLDGVGDAWNNYLDQSRDISGQTKDMFSDAFAGMNDSLYNFVTTGKLSFSDMASMFAESALRMLIQWGTAQVAMAALNAFTSTAAIPIVGPFAAPAAAASALGSAGSFMSTISSVAGMAHDGIDSVPETGTWLLQKGERVTTAGTSAKLDRTLEQVSKGRSNNNSTAAPSLTCSRTPVARARSIVGNSPSRTSSTST